MGIDFMSSWRDRNERDAKPHTIDIYQKNDAKENEKTEIKSFLDGKISSIGFATISILSGLVSLMLFRFDISNNTIMNISPIARSEYVCEKNSQGDIETLLIRANGDRHIFIKWNSNYLNSGYSTTKRCEQVASKLNKYINSENAKYIASETIENTTKICIVKSFGDLCNKENVLITIDRNMIGNKHNREDQLISPEFIDYIYTDRCRIYLNSKIQGNKQVSKREICSIPLVE